MNTEKLGFFKSGTPWVWLNAGAVSISMIMVVGLLILIAVRGLGHFWPKTVWEIDYLDSGNQVVLLGERAKVETVPAKQLIASGLHVDFEEEFVERTLLKIGNRDMYGVDFKLVVKPNEQEVRKPVDAIVFERTQWGNFYGFIQSLSENGNTLEIEKNILWDELQDRLKRVDQLRDQIHEIEKYEIGKINYKIEKLRLRERRIELSGVDDPKAKVEIETQRKKLDDDYEVLKSKLEKLYAEIARDQVLMTIQDGREKLIKLADVIKATKPNAMSLGTKIAHYFVNLKNFVTDDPREANTEGGIFPAIFGTVMMVLLMSVIVTPFGVIAAIYLREYAKQGFVTRLVRISVNNLAGVPSIVYGVFGLGFFVYFLGGNIDQLFYPEALPSPTFGSGGLLWASLTLALLTVPVVIVATEEGLARIPSSVREGSLALGATKAETLWRTVIPMASPAMMTGLILAVARAAGEVAPLMLVGAVKLAPSLPLDLNAPFLHLERKFMHLGFHIYDVGFQSPNVEAARPLVYATALILVVVIVLLNLSAIYIRNHLREKYRTMEH
ncbi:MAG: phosphate ABC transporter permease PstA [Gammaproteobacteria bacterium]|nr:phosphate ABC transporter permease PstA [Gammaproteobacteria bacterium]